MASTLIFPGRYIQGYGVIKRLSPEIARLGQSAYIICGGTAYERLLPLVKEASGKQVRISAARLAAECCDEEIERFQRLVKEDRSEVIVGLGGGKILDTAKAVANNLKLPLISFPTVAASDAPCSALSVIYTLEGVHKRIMFHAKNPDVVLVDTKIIAEAPVRYLVAGMGDALSTWFEAESCWKNAAINMTMTGDTGSLTSYTLAHLCYQNLLEYGLSAKKACEAKVVTPALEHIVETNTLLSGVGFESGGTAAAHGIQQSFTVLKETHRFMHGEGVAFGALASLFLTDKPRSLIDEVYSFCESLGLPTTLAGIGLPQASDADLKRVALAAMDKDNPIHNEPLTVTPEAIIDAIKMADYEGSTRKKPVSPIQS
jgi:glycerol dehydrogenase